MKGFIALFLIALALVLGFALSGPIRERWQDSNDFRRQLEQLDLQQRLSAQQEAERQRQATQMARDAAANFYQVGTILAGLLILALVGDSYMKRRRPLVRFGGEMVARQLIEQADPILIAALAERMHLNGLAAIEAARNPGMPVNYSPHFGRAGELQRDNDQTVAGELIKVPPPALTVTPLAPAALLADWKQRKLICQSDNSLLLGFDKTIGAIEPSNGVYLPLGEQSDVALIAVSGDSGSGKTNTARFLMAQAAMRGSAIVICDPHGRDNQQSLVQSCAPLASSFLLPPAVSWGEIHDAIAMVDHIGRARLNGAPDRQHILLVLDEYCDLARNAPDAKAIAKLLINVADSYRKVGITAALIVHHWRINEWRSGTLKDAVQAVVFHRMSKSEAKLFVSDSTISQQISFLPQGDALYFKRGTPAPTRLTGIPELKRTHLDEARDLFVPAPSDLPSMSADADADTSTDADTGSDRGADTLLERLIASAPPRADGPADTAPPAPASTHYADAGADADTDTAADRPERTPTSAGVAVAEQVSAYLQAYALAGMTRAQARDTLARSGVTFANEDWTDARRAVGLN